MPAEAKVIDVAAAPNVNGFCWRCRKACCNCASCVAGKDGLLDVCNRCREALKKEEAAGANPR